ncbi:MAG: hypothetical protein NTW28_21870 [Candidatus Solibacter sp.]|nr:hypothetical protein [Candidatus Solibacter sp.]
MKTVLLLVALAGCARAQNSDLGLLVGISGPTSSVEVNGSNVRIVSGSVGAHGQINYAAQLRETSAGRLYLELPLLIGGHATGTVAGTVHGSAGGVFFFTPGLRLNIAPHSRVSFYVAAGVGPAAFGESLTEVGKGFVRSSTGWTVSVAADFGGGLDFRLTRLMSLRMEARDFVTRKGLGGAQGHHHPIYGFGVGFHW